LASLVDALIVLAGLLLPLVLLAGLAFLAFLLIRRQLRRTRQAGAQVASSIQRFKALEFHCSNCSFRLPNVRRPRNLRQLFLGGWTCPQCGAEVDRHGQQRI